MKVKAVTKYLYKGKEYKSLKDIKEEIHNSIGIGLLDAMQRVCPLERHKDYEKMLNLICKPEIRNLLTDCLNVTFEQIDEDDNETVINVLDIK